MGLMCKGGLGLIWVLVVCGRVVSPKKSVRTHRAHTCIAAVMVVE